MLRTGSGGLTTKNRLMLAFMVLGFCYLVYSSSIKNMGMYIWDYDTRCWYSAGTCWWNGESPHDSVAYTRTWTELFGAPPNNQATFVYPPTMALLSLPLALMPWSVAAWTFRIVNLLAFLGICYFSRQLMATPNKKLRISGSTGLYVGLAAFLGSAMQGINQGQCALIVVCGCLAAWHGYQRKILWLFLIGFLVASIKPQVSMIPLLFILFSGGWRWFGYGAGLSGIFCIIVLLVVPVPDLFGAYQGSLDDHLDHQEFNQWDWYCGAPALLGGTPFGKLFMVLGVLAGVLGACWVGWRQQKLADTLKNRLRHHQLMWILAASTMPIHIYDGVGHIFVTITLWVLPGWHRRAIAFFFMYIGGKSYAITNRLEGLGGSFAELGPLVQAQWTSMAALALLLCFFYWYWRDFMRKTSG
jgi:hypothetical protein